MRNVMMMRVRNSVGFSLLFGVALSIGCSSSDGSGSGSASDVCNQYLNAEVGFLTRCEGSVVGNAINRTRFFDVCTRAINAPGATNFANAIATCSANASSAACGEEPVCKTGVGSLADGAPCQADYQCSGGSCKKAPKANCGTCGQLLPIGATCDDTTGQECVVGATCLFTSSSSGANPPTNTSTCVAETIAKAGESCDGASGQVITCDTGLFCFHPPSTTGTSAPAQATCRAPAAVGGDCGQRQDCVSGLACLASKCAQPIAAGGACTSAGEQCAIGFGCSNKVCTAMDTVGAGAACDEAHLCARGTCNGEGFESSGSGEETETQGKCVDPLPDGAPCTIDTGTSPPDPNRAECDEFAECIAGICTVQDPSTCK